MEHKYFAFKIDEVTGDGQFQGYASVFDNIDLGGDVVEKGAFNASLNETGGKIPILDHHNPAQQIGWNLSAREDDHGLYVKGQLDLNVQNARERHSLMRMAAKIGGNTGLSIGFQTVREEPDFKDHSVRRLKEVRLIEYSLVTFAMNPDAQVTHVKSNRYFLRRSLESLRDTLYGFAAK